MPEACSLEYNPITLAMAIRANVSQAMRTRGEACGVGWEAFMATCSSSAPLDNLFGLMGAVLPADFTQMAFESAGKVESCGTADFEGTLTVYGLFSDGVEIAYVQH